jgi:hypothetical protein
MWEFAVTDPAEMPVRGSAAPAPKIATVRAPGGGRPPYGDARRLARCLACPDSAGPTDASQASVRLSALRHPSIGVSEATKQNPGAKNAPRERDRLFEMVRNGACVRRYCALAPLAGRGQLAGRHMKDRVRGTHRKGAPHPYPLPAPLRHSASKTRVNALMAGRGSAPSAGQRAAPRKRERLVDVVEQAGGALPCPPILV